MIVLEMEQDVFMDIGLKNNFASIKKIKNIRVMMLKNLLYWRKLWIIV
jgi:hypothetical protein